MPKRRFSKQMVIDQLNTQIDHFEGRYKFTHETGYAQVEGRGEEINRAYGLWSYAVELKQWILEGSLD